MIILFESTKAGLDNIRGGCDYSGDGKRAWANLLGRYHCYKLRGNLYTCYGVTFDSKAAAAWLEGNDKIGLLQ